MITILTHKGLGDGSMRVLQVALEEAGIRSGEYGVEVMGEELPQANVLVLMGKECLQKVAAREGIYDWRGSVLEVGGRKVIPTLAVSDIMKNWPMRSVFVADLKRIKVEAKTPQIERMHREIVIPTTLEQAEQELKAISEQDVVSFDIETSHKQIECIGFATSATRAVVIKFWYGWEGSYWRTEDEVRLWCWIRKIMEGGQEKVAQNGLYDRWYLEDMGIRTRKLYWDTLLMSSLLYPELPHDLGFLTSIYTDQPYYKEMGKIDDAQTHWLYNGLDACVTYEIAEKLKTELIDGGLWDFYVGHVRKLINPLYGMSRRGILVDVGKMRFLKRSYKRGIEKIQSLLNKMTGGELNVNSPKQVKEYLYGKCGYKEQKKRVKGVEGGRVTADVDAIKFLLSQHNNPALRYILAIREYSKVVGTYLEAHVSGDGRMRTAYNIAGTETGRLSSSATPTGEGGNLQNVPPLIRKMFLPDAGKVLVAADQSQAEARVVAYLSGDERMIGYLNDPTKDIHCFVASLAFGKRVDEIGKKSVERTIAKKIGHGSNYARSAEGIAKKDGISLEMAKKCQAAYFTMFPGVQSYHRKIQEQLRKNRTLVTPFGRRRVFMGALNQDLFREAYAYVPQSTVGDLSNFALREIDEQFSDLALDAQLLLQVHDELVVQCREEDVATVTMIMRKALEREIVVGTRRMIIPAEIHVGKTWRECK